MKTAKRWISRALAAALALCLCIGAASAYAIYSETAQQLLGNYRFNLYSALYVDGNSYYRGGAWIDEANIVYLPAGSLGASATLYSENGTALLVTGMKYTTESIYFASAVTSDRRSTTPVYASGTVSVKYNGQYLNFDTLQAKMPARSALLMELSEELDENGDYPVNAAGETYGSGMLSEVTGRKPDLIRALGVDDVEGYIRRTDIYPEISTTEEALRYMEARKEIDEIPLYDLNGAVIGSFALDKTEEEAVPEELMMAQAKAAGPSSPAAPAQAKADGTVEDLNRRLWALHKDSLVDGDYPRNASGETYGSDALAGFLGHHPDLILAMGQEEKEGYIRRSDLFPVLKTTEEVLEYMKNLPKRRMIPLYDCEGAVIGEFEVSSS